ncbi:MAG: hypothetical protein ABII24_00845 [bacterium]
MQLKHFRIEPEDTWCNEQKLMAQYVNGDMDGETFWGIIHKDSSLDWPSDDEE